MYEYLMEEKTQYAKNTNLAAEYYVLSMLYRIGVEAYITLGNKKSVNILVKKNRKNLTINVKSIRNITSFSIENWRKNDKNHYLVFVSFLRRIRDTKYLPEVYVVPSTHLEKKFRELNNKSLIYKKNDKMVVELSRLRKLGRKYLNNWDFFI